jgi:hypothetical protein
MLSHYSGWPINIFLILIIYAAILKLDLLRASSAANRMVAGMLTLQFLGYCGIYVLTPHDLIWHLYFSFPRLLFHVLPAGLFLYFCNITEPEMVFTKTPREGNEMNATSAM